MTATETAAISALSESLTVGTRVEDATARPGTVTDVEPATNDVQVRWDHRDSTEWVGAEFVHAFDPSITAPVLAWIDLAHGDETLAYLAAAAEKGIANLDAAEIEYDRIVHTHGRRSRRAVVEAHGKQERAAEVLMHLSAAVRFYVWPDLDAADPAIQAVAAER
jgi:hypothetical protein